MLTSLLWLDDVVIMSLCTLEFSVAPGSCSASSIREVWLWPVFRIWTVLYNDPKSHPPSFGDFWGMLRLQVLSLRVPDN